MAAAVASRFNSHRHCWLHDRRAGIRLCSPSFSQPGVPCAAQRRLSSAAIPGRTPGFCPLQRGVYARHGRELTGCKSPVGEPASMNSTATTSLRQGRLREEGSGGSPRQTCEPTNRNVIRGQVPGAMQHPMPKPSGSGDMVNDAAAQGKLTSLSGEICSTGSEKATGSGLRPTSKGVEKPPVPKAVLAARRTATLGGMGQKSAEAIVAARPLAGRAVKGRTSWNKEEP